MFYSKKNSGLVGVSMNVDEGVETTVSSLKPNPKKPKKKTLPDRKRMRSLRPRLSSSSNSSSNERMRSLRPRLSSSSNSSSNELAYTIG